MFSDSGRSRFRDVECPIPNSILQYYAPSELAPRTETKIIFQTFLGGAVCTVDGRVNIWVLCLVGIMHHAWYHVGKPFPSTKLSRAVAETQLPLTYSMCSEEQNHFPTGVNLSKNVYFGFFKREQQKTCVPEDTGTGTLLHLLFHKPELSSLSNNVSTVSTNPPT